MSSNYPPNQPPPGGSYPPGPPPGNQSGPYPGYQGYQGPQPSGPPPQQKSGMRPLFYILGGCGGLILIGVIIFVVGGYLAYNKAKSVAKEAGLDSDLIQKKPALAAAKAVVALNPDLEVVSTDDEKGLLTVRDKKTGDTVTITADDANKGKISFKKNGKDVGSVDMHADKNSASLEFKSDQGTTKFGAGVTDTVPGWISTYPGASNQWDFAGHVTGLHTGSFHFMTSDDQDKISAFYADALARRGLRVGTTVSTSNGDKNTLVTAEDDATGRNCLVTITPDKDSGVRVQVIFKSKE